MDPARSDRGGFGAGGTLDRIQIDAGGARDLALPSARSLTCAEDLGPELRRLLSDYATRRRC